MGLESISQQRFFYCPKCSGPLKKQAVRGKDRLVCSICYYVFYENPVVGVAGILLNQSGQILLGRRKSSRYSGIWCIPCGYLEYDEDIHEGLVREFKEETNLDVEVVKVFSVQSNFHDPERHSVGVWFLVKLVSGEMTAGDDLDQIGFFDLDSPPPLAFPTDRAVLDHLLNGSVNLD